VKRHWEVDELIESWTLLPEEMEVLGNKTGGNRIGFALNGSGRVVVSMSTTLRLMYPPSGYFAWKQTKEAKS